MKKYVLFLIQLFIIGSILIEISCNNGATKKQIVDNSDSALFLVKHPDWIKSANIYEVNIRQYSEKGTLKEFEKHLPRLKEMGVDILWFMPIQPVGKKNRKGELGSYYSVKDYTAVNPEFGTMEDFKSLVQKVHELDMFVILDWVANHTAWDHAWSNAHPEYYTKDSLGNFMPPTGTDWSDVIDLNYDNKNMRAEMLDALKFWITTADVDGFRCDVASFVPTDFWEELRLELDKVKNVFMLAEAEQIDHHYKSFDASYGWEFHHIMNKIAKGEETVSAIDEYFAKDSAIYPANAIRMHFITNHDENSWNGTVQERMGDAVKAMAVLSYTIPGMPLIYSGQEAGLNKRLAFFEKDEINWELNKELGNFYKSLIALKKDNSALYNGNEGAVLKRVKTNSDTAVYAFTRENMGNKVLVIINLSNESIKVKLENDSEYIDMKSYFSDEIYKGGEFELNAWDYRVFVK